MVKPVILCVDDEKMVLTSLKEQIKSRLGSGYDIETAESGPEALDLFQELQENQVITPLVISDYIMPGMKGDELLQQIHDLIPATMKIMLTGQAALDGITNAINKANLYRYIAKPWEAEDLSLTITEAVTAFFASRQLAAQNRRLEKYNQDLQRFSDAIVETLVTALDTRDTTTAGHSKRMAAYAVEFARAINEVKSGPYGGLSFSEEEIQQLRYAALLHDIGKIGVPESVLLKDTRLSREKQEELKQRFFYARYTLEFKRQLSGLKEAEEALLLEMEEDLAFVLEICQRGIISEEEQARIRVIAAQSVLHLNGSVINLLNAFEVQNLTMARGNLTDEEQKLIQSHTLHTYNILKGIPWIESLSQVPEIAASHHEKLDGSGYHNHSKGEAIPVQSRILMILDIFEALTASDRPYKPALSLEQALRIMEKEVSSGCLDKDLYDIFIQRRVYQGRD